MISTFYQLPGCEHFYTHYYAQLLEITSYRELYISDIAKKLGITYANANYLIKKLRDAGFVKRVRVSGIMMISLTEKGQDTVNQWGVKD
jgi:DNA-binding MarR family transcriptional regulator